MSEKMPIEKKKVTTPKFRVSFPNVFEAKSFQNQEAKFSITMLFDKKTDLKAMKEAALNAAIEKWGEKTAKDLWAQKISIKGKKLRVPFRDGDEKADMNGYEGMIFVSASSKQRPGVVDQNRVPITAADGSFYAGCYARATLIAFAYDTAGNIGVSFSLQNVQKWADGEQFSGRRKAEDEFDSIEDGSEEASNFGSEEEEEDFTV